MLKLRLIIFSLILLFLTGCSSFEQEGDFNVNVTNNISNPVPVNITAPLNEDGNAVVGNLEDNMGRKAKITTFNDLIVGTRQNDIAIQFQYNIASFDVNLELVDTGTVTQNNSQAVISSGTGLNAQAHIESFESIRYSSGSESGAMYTVAFVTGGVVGVEQLTGPYNEDEDGFVIGYNGTTLITGLIVGGVKDFTSQSQWEDPLNGSGLSGCNVNFSQLHQYRITYGWLGIAPIRFEIYCNKDIEWVNFNTIDKSNQQITPTINNPVLPIQMHIIKNNSTTDVIIRTSSWNGWSVGTSGSVIRPGTRFFTAHMSKSISANTLTNLISIRSNETFFGKSNRIESILQNLNVGVEGTKPVEIYILRNANVTGLNFTQVNVNNSVSSVDYDGSLVTGGEIIDIITVSKTGDFDKFLWELDIDFHKGEIITIAAISTGASDVIPTLRWGELF